MGAILASVEVLLIGVVALIYFHYHDKRHSTDKEE